MGDIWQTTEHTSSKASERASIPCSGWGEGTHQTLSSAWVSHDPSSTLGSPTTMLSPLMPSPIPLPTSPIPHIDASAENQFTVNALETWAGWKCKTHDLHSMLAVCACGQAVLESEISYNRDIIMCHCAGCEMGWVSQILIQEKSKTCWLGFQYHLRCVQLEYSINLWICKACEVSGGGQRWVAKWWARAWCSTFLMWQLVPTGS